jgi:hypothetical protein
MNNLRELEIKGLINEIIFLKEDLKVKKELSKMIEKEFHCEIDSILEEDVKLKELWEISLTKKEKSRSKMHKNKTKSNSENKSEIIEDISSNIKNDGLKKIYRDIAKKTHPDKILDSDKNSTYIMATESYNKNDILDLIYYATKLGIEYNHNSLDVKKMRENIISMKSKIGMYETSLPYQWYYNDKDVSILKNYIATQFLTS